MTISARILLDSLNPAGVRLTTWGLSYPRFIHSEFMTHRVFSRNAASSRAIPIEKMILATQTAPAMPVWWGKNQAGMQAKEELSLADKMDAHRAWLDARDRAIETVKALHAIGLHKQIANRILEPWMHITVIASTTDHANFFKLRAHPDAQPEFQALASKMKVLFEENSPRKLEPDEWHLPLVDADEGLQEKDALKASVARCARVSYVRQNDRKPIEDDITLHDRLMQSGHWSPFEHQAKAVHSVARYGNFRGFIQYRKHFYGEGEEK